MVKSATRVLRILKLVGSSREGMKHNEIAKALEIPKGSLSLILADLINEGFLFTDVSGTMYRIGPQVLSLAGQYLASLDIVKISQPIIRDLVEETKESAGLGVRIGTETMIVCKENSPEPFKWDLEIGIRYSMYSTAAGKAILAFLEEQEIDEILDTIDMTPKTDKTITNKSALKAQLKQIRKDGFADAREEQFIGMIALGVPIFNNEGRVVASIVQPIPTPRYSEKREQTILVSLKEAGMQLSMRLGYNQ